MAAMKEDDRTNQRLKRLVQRFAQSRLSATFAAWKEEAEFERSVHQLDALLQGCEDAFDLPPHERRQAAVSAVLQLLQRVPLLSALCPAAQQFVAAHAKLLLLSDAVEMPTCPEDSQQLYAVLGCKFAQSWSSAAAAAAAASMNDSHSGGDEGLSHTALPCSCLAAVAEPNKVVALLAISRPVYMEACRLHREAHVARLVDALCRLPCLRHTPIKELHRLACHLKEATYQPGQMLLHQGREVPDIHFLISGSVLLTYSAPLTAAAKPCHMLSSDGAALILPPVAAAAAAPATSGLPAGPAAAAAAAVVAAVAAGGSSNGGPRSSGLADLLRLGQQAVQPAAVVGVRGPGAVLGDDALRERRLAVGVLAATAVTTLKIEVLKFMSCMDPLTLRLLGRLQQQQLPEQQRLIQGVLEATDTRSHPQAQQLHRELQQLAAGLVQRPRGLGSGSGSGSRARLNPEDEAWEAGLPRGLTVDKCAGLPQSASVQQLMEAIRDVDDFRRMQGSLLLHSSDTAVVPGGVLASALEDVAAAVAAVCHDEGLQLIRWTARRWLLLAQLEPGSSKRAGLEGLADALLSSAARMAGVLSRSEGLPVLGLAAGVASGSCFVQYESRAGLPAGPATARSTSTLNRQTLGPGRHTLLGAAALGAATPKTPGVVAAAGRRCAGKSQQRRRMRRKFEALEDLLAGACDVLPPPPEHLLTQPPPASGSGAASELVSPADSRSRDGAAAGGRARRPNLKISVVVEGGAAPGGVNGVSAVTPGGGGKSVELGVAGDCGAADALTPTPRLAYNQLACLPLELPAALPKLTSLDLSHNKLQELPCTFAALSCLKLLFLAHNQLAALPSNLTRLFLLSTLDGNPGLDPEIADKGMGLGWAYKWWATRKTSAASAAQRAAALAVQQRAQQQS
ncbi:hypothetical protein OEZ85_008912 [Tetradesmus obliquus]|uniref:Cyclic nucleotide-binding domain-containing protein n=1 Tax=Tetradesmus obliquus TaxID=3088 RepID=A0ABY8TMF5_TETOB|nr:hypothetical protein OEZ85_008912 [Tetradesmus obliquus]